MMKKKMLAVAVCVSNVHFTREEETIYIEDSREK